MRHLLVLILSLAALASSAQSHISFTHHVQQQLVGQGSVVLIQDEELAALVDNLPQYEEPEPEPVPIAPVTKSVPDYKQSTPSAAVAAKQTESTSTSTTKYTGTRARHKQKGFRIQLYSGTGNSEAKKAAKDMEAKVRRLMPELSVYCHFKSPRWICRVGDFATREEAQRYLTKIRSKNISPEATIVTDEVLVAD